MNIFVLFQFCDITLTPRFGLNLLESVDVTTDVCFINNQLVARGVPTGSGKCFFNAVDADTGDLTYVRPASCDHRQPSITACQVQENREAIVERCRTCSIFRIQDIATKTVIELPYDDKNIKPGAMCKGPETTFIIFDRNTKNIVQLAYNNRSLSQVQKGFGPPLRLSSTPLSMCFNGYHGTLVILTKSALKGILLTTGDTLWSIPSIPGAQHVCTGYGGIFVSGYGESVTLLDAADGCTLKTLLAEQGLGNIPQVACSEDNNKLVVLHGHGQITCYTLGKITAPAY